MGWTPRLILAALLIVPIMLALPAHSAVLPEDVRGLVPVCANTYSGWRTIYFADKTTGDVKAVVLVDVENETSHTIKLDSLRGELIAIGGPKSSPYALLLDRENGTLILERLPPVWNLTRWNDTGTPVLIAKSDNGYIRSAYARIANHSLIGVAKVTVFEEGREGNITSRTVIVRYVVNVRNPSQHTIETLIMPEGFTITPLPPCVLVEVAGSNKTVNVVALRMLDAPSDAGLTVHLGELPPFDTISARTRSQMTTTLVVSHSDVQPTRPYIILADRQQGKATVIVGEPIYGFALVKPVCLGQVNSTTYAATLALVEASGERRTGVLLFTSGLSPQLRLYVLPYGVDAVIDRYENILLIIRNGIMEEMPLSEVIQAMERLGAETLDVNLTMRELGANYQPITSRTGGPLTIEKPVLEPQEEGSSPSPTRPSPGETVTPQEEGGEHLILIIIGVVAGGAAGAVALVLLRRRREEVPSEVRFSY